MIIINSLKRINESDAAYDIRYKADIAKADAEYQKADPTYGPLSLPRMFRSGEAAADRKHAIDIAKERYTAAKHGFVSKHDYNEAKIEAFKAKRAALQKAEQSSEGEHKSHIIKRIGGAIADHPYVAAGTVAGLVGLAALQKRKKRLPEPGSYYN